MRKCLLLIGLISLTINSRNCVAIEGGFSLSGDQWAHAVRIQSTAGSCSASIITPQHAITAAHCVNDGAWTARVLGGKDSEVDLGSATVAYIDPRYSKDDSNYDIAVLSLTLKPNTISNKNNVRLQPSRTYLEILNAKSPYRLALIVGHGLDERSRIGSRKAALVSGITPSVGSAEFLWAYYSPHTGATKPGDSGGGIYMLRENKVDLVAVTSGGNSMKRTFRGDTFESMIERYSPIAPSLCLAPREIHAALSFDASECAGIIAARSALSTSFNDAPLSLVLHIIRLLKESPQISVMENEWIIEELAVKAFVLGSRSTTITQIIVDYLNTYGSGTGMNKARWRTDMQSVGNTLVESGDLKKGVDRAIFNVNEIRDVLTQRSDSWDAENIRRYQALRGQACPHENCLVTNEVAYDLTIKSGKGDWTTILPAKSHTTKFKELSSLVDISLFVCRIAEHLYLEDDSIVDDLLSGGVSRGNLSTYKSNEKRSISVNERMHINAYATLSSIGSGDSYFYLEASNVKFKPGDEDRLTGGLSSLGFQLNKNADGFSAKIGTRHFVSVFGINDNDGALLRIAHTGGKMTSSEFGIWQCSHR